MVVATGIPEILVRGFLRRQNGQQVRHCGILATPECDMAPPGYIRDDLGIAIHLVW